MRQSVDACSGVRVHRSELHGEATEQIRDGDEVSGRMVLDRVEFGEAERVGRRTQR